MQIATDRFVKRHMRRPFGIGIVTDSEPMPQEEERERAAGGFGAIPDGSSTRKRFRNYHFGNSRPGAHRHWLTRSDSIGEYGL
jgi:hypothetical protein